MFFSFFGLGPWPLFSVEPICFQSPMAFGAVLLGAICFCAPLASGVHWLLVPFDIGAPGL